MKLKGDYSGGTTYSVGDVVRYTDGEIYHLQKPCKAGTTPVDTFFWSRVEQVVAQCVKLILDGIDMAVAQAEAAIPQNISDEAITLKGTGDAEYLITVDDSGDTPELAVTLIEDEEEEGS